MVVYFFDTYKVANKFDRGEIIQDRSFFSKNDINSINITNKGWLTFAWILIVVGVLALANKFFITFDIFYIIRQYFVPAFFILIGVYLLIKGKDK